MNRCFLCFITAMVLLSVTTPLQAKALRACPCGFSKLDPRHGPCTCKKKCTGRNCVCNHGYFSCSCNTYAKKLETVAKKITKIDKKVDHILAASKPHPKQVTTKRPRTVAPLLRVRGC